MKSKIWAAAGVLTALVVGGAATPATAARPLAACGAGDYNLEVVGDSYNFARATGANSVVSGDPGVTLSISRTTTFGVSGTLGGNSQISGSVVVATISQQLNYSITASLSGTSSSSGSWTVPSGYRNGGQLEIGARKHSGSVLKYHAKPKDCSNGSLVAEASYNAPQTGWYFKHSKL